MKRHMLICHFVFMVGREKSEIINQKVSNKIVIREKNEVIRLENEIVMFRIVQG